MMVACMPLFAPFFRGNTRLSGWSTYIRSRLFRTNPSTQRSDDSASQPQYEKPSNRIIVKSDDSYLESGERKSNTSSGPNGQDGRVVEWFDRTDPIMHETV